MGEYTRTEVHGPRIPTHGAGWCTVRGWCSLLCDRRGWRGEQGDVLRGRESRLQAKLKGVDSAQNPPPLFAAKQKLPVARASLRPPSHAAVEDRHPRADLNIAQ